MSRIPPQEKMSSKPVTQFCAICEREKKTPTNGIPYKYTNARHSTAPLQEIFEHSTRHKYGNLPTKKYDDYFTQVTEPQWLRRGNLKESDLVCKRHLAILMRGVDRGCEGGCCSPLHRGARLCKPGTLKSIPPTWRRRFVNHPKIKDEDKSLMLLCWDCYKKHMDRMSKYGDPMGRSFGNRRSLQRSHSMIDTSDHNTILQAMKRYKSMEKLDSSDVSPTSTSPLSSSNTSLRRFSTRSSSPKPESLIESPGNEREAKSTPSRRTARGRKVNKGRRSPSPPNNISPVRTSVVHSRRRHSPHKGSKSPIIRSELTTVLAPVAHTSPVLSTREPKHNVFHASRFSIDEGALADTESPRPPPVPPTALFSPRSDRSDDVIDVFGTRKSRSPKQYPVPPPLEENETEMAKIQSENLQPRLVADGTISKVNGCLRDDVTIEVPPDQLDDGQNVTEYSTIPQQEESIASSDEMAEIFGGKEDSRPEMRQDYATWDNPTQRTPESEDNGLIMLPQATQMLENSLESPEIHHRHEGSGSSSDKTGDTQIAMDVFTLTHQEASDVILTAEKENIANDIDASSNASDEVALIPSAGEDSVADSGAVVKGTVPETIETPEEATETGPLQEDLNDSTSSLSSLKKSAFTTPTRNSRAELTPPEASVLNYSLSPQSFRRLESIQLSFSDDAVADDARQRSNFNSYDDVRDFSHPMRNHVLMKVPRRSRSGSKQRRGLFSFERIPAEDVMIFPDILSFLDGVTQSIGADASMYPKDDTQIIRVNFKKEQNRAAHRTSQFPVEQQLVVRRGQAFEIELELNEDYEGNEHNIVVELLTGDHPKVSSGTHIFLPIRNSDKNGSTYGAQNGGAWSARLVSAREKVVTLAVSPPAVCSVGAYAICFQIEKDGKRSRWNSGNDDDRSLIVLFNPWCIDDAVYMSSESDRVEYVIADTGCIYAGNSINLLPLSWIFGQYEDDALAASIMLLEACDLTSIQRADPVAVTRALCRHIADNIVTSTSITYAKRRKDWISSHTSDILRQYLQTGNLTVPNNHVAIAALLVAVFRCLGFPTRPVTCLNCAFETDIPMTANIHYSEEGHSLDFMNTDTLWPSYTWAGVWMSRVDLPPGFGGWQAVVASKDRHSSVGPTPVYAIKKGQTSCCEEARIFFCALNADKKHWVVSQDGSMVHIKSDRNCAGSAIITKSVGTTDVQNITKLYKFPEGSEENKLAIHTAQMHCGIQSVHDDLKSEEVEISLYSTPNVIPYGNDVDVVTKIANNGHDVRHLKINVDGMVLAQDGTPTLKLQRETILAEVLAGESVDVPVKINLSSALHKLAHDCHLVFTAFATIRENPDCYLVSDCFVGVKYPDVEIQLHGEFKVDGEVTVSSRIRNPLPFVLRNAEIGLSTSGLAPLSISSNSGKSVPPWQVFKSEGVFRCQRAGRHTVVATFRSDHLDGATGSQEIEIT